MRFLDWIWHVRGSLTLAPGLSGDEAFDRLDPLFRQTGTSHERTGDTLTFRKKDPAAQDKMSIFDDGTLRVERGAAGSILRYHLTSRILLFCFLAPLLFLGIAQFTNIVMRQDHPTAGTAAKSGKTSHGAKKPASKDAALPLNPIDKFLGAPAPEKPKKDKAAGGDDDRRKPSSTPAYVFAGIFATLYIVGRILEDRLARSLFKRTLMPS